MRCALVKKIAPYILFLTAVYTSQSLASNRYYADNTLEPTHGFAWDWSVGASYYVEDTYLIGMSSYDDGVELDLNLAVSYNKFYLDIDHHQLSGGLIIGYSLIDKYDWGLDILATNVQAGLDEKGLKRYNGNKIEALVNIQPRNYDFDAGLRLSRRFDNSQISFEYLYDISGSHNGWVFNSFVSQIIPWRNWELRTGIGISAYSEKFTNYYFGINAQEATLKRAEYSTDTSSSVKFEIHGEYPLNRNWVFLTGWLSTWFSKEIENSPIIKQGYQHKVKVGVRYVF
ncbi:MipA/OmpV family protein [Pseudoalteromonas sp. MMG010]|nr:MipA/OmpV family protein [Pseudoalteromonas sp. MMG010]